MPSEKQIVAFKIGARARKMANEDCLVEGYEILWTAIAEAKQTRDTEMQALLERELSKFEAKFVNEEADE